MSASILDFRMKLLSGDNVVLVESAGFESELFLPHVEDGRIYLQNIIPNRRCCNLKKRVDMEETSRYRCITANNKLSKNIRPQEREPFEFPRNNSNIIVTKSTLTRKTKLKGHTVTSQEQITDCRLPIAYSTPKQCIISKTKENINNKPTPPTPEAPRLPSPQEVIEQTESEMPSNIKLLRLYHKYQVEQLNSARCAKNQNSNRDSNNVDMMSQIGKHNLSTLVMPITPELKPGKTVLRQGKLEKNKLKNSKNYETPTKWRKCITPVRTYSRRSNGNLQRSNTCIGKKKPDVHTQVVPTYLTNPTQGAKCTHNVEIKLRRRKLVVDPKADISPITYAKGTRKVKFERSKTQLPRTHDDYENCKLSAFDLLTNSNRHRLIATKLNQQFRNNCINKVCTTLPNYKQLTTLRDVTHKRKPVPEKDKTLSIKNFLPKVKKFEN